MAEEITTAHSGTREGIGDAAARLGDELGLRAGDALLIVDLQRDFLPGGALGVPEGDQVIAPLNEYITAFEERGLPIFMTRDWHPPDHCSFQSAGGPWPPHCVRDTPGAQWPESLKIAASARIISKATEPAAEAYSGFSGTELLTLLRDQGVRRLFVGGLATDYCVRATVLDARSNGFEVVVLADAIRGVNVQPGDDERAVEEMLASGATLFDPARTPN
ncbi:MAG TPA: nicotinamidase [Steroidobacter sp.]